MTDLSHSAQSRGHPYEDTNKDGKLDQEVNACSHEGGVRQFLTSHVTRKFLAAQEAQEQWNEWYGAVRPRASCSSIFNC